MEKVGLKKNKEKNNEIQKLRGSGISPIRLSPITGESPGGILAKVMGVYWRKSGGHSPILAVLDASNSSRIRSDMISSCRSKYNESVKVESEQTNDAYSRSINVEGQGEKACGENKITKENKLEKG